MGSKTSTLDGERPIAKGSYRDFLSHLNAVNSLTSTQKFCKDYSYNIQFSHCLKSCCSKICTKLCWDSKGSTRVEAVYYTTTAPEKPGAEEQKNLLQNFEQKNVLDVKVMTVDGFYTFFADIDQCRSLVATEKGKQTPRESYDQTIEPCSICLDKKVNLVLKCTHGFCEGCIIQWSAKDQSCPICRGAYQKATSFVNEFYSLVTKSEIKKELTDTIKHALEFLSSQPSAERLVQQYQTTFDTSRGGKAFDKKEQVKEKGAAIEGKDAKLLA